MFRLKETIYFIANEQIGEQQTLTIRSFETIAKTETPQKKELTPQCGSLSQACKGELLFDT
tara:strand:- start:708 stop:890 length:183 start_codon:yes stop_codon:yes gene_type:complete